MTDKPDHPRREEKPPQIPPALVPPDASEQETSQHSRTRLLLVVGVGLLLLIAAVTVLLLPPSSHDVVIATPPAPTQTTVVPPGVLDQAAIAESSREASRLLTAWLRTQAAAEADNVAGWGGEAYELAVSGALECDRLFGEKQFVAASAACEEAIGRLETLRTEKETLLAEALDAGDRALASGDPEAAVAQFNRALAMAPDNQHALDGQRRAANLPEVLRLLEVGLSLEAANDLPGAQESFSAAASLDPDDLSARENLARVQAVISEQRFRQAMSLALQSLSAGDFSAADQALRQAKALQPDDPSLADLQVQLSRARQARKLENLRQQGGTLEKSESWRQALKVCEQALALDAHAAFAASCKERVSPRIALDDRFKSILSKPERLYADGPLQEAKALLGHAAQVTPRGPVLTTQIDQLASLVQLAETQVEVLIQSDGLTNVVIFHVGRLGMFQEKRLTLRTGNYTATGSRNGFRDVRKTLQVRPGSGTPIFSLRCEEPI